MCSLWCRLLQCKMYCDSTQQTYLNDRKLHVILINFLYIFDVLFAVVKSSVIKKGMLLF